MADTTTASTDVRYALCACCTGHDKGENANRMLTTTVACPECGQPCSCEGCAADAWAEQEEPK